VNTSFAQRQQVLLEQIALVREKIGGLEANLRETDQELDGLSAQRPPFQLLGDACDALNKLDEIGSASLFWGEQLNGFDPARRLGEVSASVAEFRQRLAGVEQARERLLADIDARQDELDDLDYALDEVREAEESAKYDFVIERDETTRPFRAMVMPWTTEEEDRRRFRKTLAVALLLMLVIGGVPMVWTLPKIDKANIEVPERLAKMVEKKVQPKPVEKVKEAKKEDVKKDEPKKEEPKKPVEAKAEPPKPKPKPQPKFDPSKISALLDKREEIEALLEG
jgi:hypothetical protein